MSTRRRLAAVLGIALTLLVGCGSAQPPATTVSPTAAAPPVREAITAETIEQVECLHTLTGHNNRVAVVAFSANGACLASASWDDTIRLWNLRTWEEVHAFGPHEVDMNGMAFSKDGSLLASPAAIWEVDSLQVLHELEWGAKVSGQVAFSPDGTLLVVHLRNEAINVWDVASGEVLRTLEEDPDNPVLFSIAISPDGALLAAGGCNGTVSLWDVASGKIAGRLEHGNRSDVHDVAFSLDGTLLASGGTDYTARLWDLDSGEVAHTLRHGNGLYGLAFSPDGSLLATAVCDRTVMIWDVATGKLLGSLRHADEVMTVAFSPDGSLLASGGYDDIVYLWGVAH